MLFGGLRFQPGQRLRFDRTGRMSPFIEETSDFVFVIPRNSELPSEWSDGICPSCCSLSSTDLGTVFMTKTGIRSGPLAGRRGAVTVEVALTLPVFAIFLAGLMEFGHVFMVSNTLSW